VPARQDRSIASDPSSPAADYKVAAAFKPGRMPAVADRARRETKEAGLPLACTFLRGGVTAKDRSVDSAKGDAHLFHRQGDAAVELFGRG
jgi:hypothetical protein